MLTIPHAAPSSIVPAPVARPEAATAVVAKDSPAFRLLFRPEVVEIFDLTDAPKAALEAAGVEPGTYWLPAATQFCAVPGVNGIRSQDGWKTEDILQYGYNDAITENARSVGWKLLGAWEEVEAAFCPAGVPAGPLLRRVPVVWQGMGGWRYMTPWEGLRASAAGRPAKATFDRALQGCWIASLIMRGVIQPASDAIIAEKRDAARAKVLRIQAQVGLPEPVQEARVSAAKVEAEAAEKPALTPDSAKKPVTRKSRGQADG